MTESSLNGTVSPSASDSSELSVDPESDGESEKGHDDGRVWSEPDEDLRERLQRMLVAFFDGQSRPVRRELPRTDEHGKLHLPKTRIADWSGDARRDVDRLGSLSGLALDAVAATWGVRRLTAEDVVEEVHDL